MLMRARVEPAASAGAGAGQPPRPARHRTSLVVDPWGAVIGELDHDEPGVLLADLDPEAPAKARAAIPALANARPFTGP